MGKEGNMLGKALLKKHKQGKKRVTTKLDSENDAVYLTEDKYLEGKEKNSVIEQDALSEFIETVKMKDVKYVSEPRKFYDEDRVEELKEGQITSMRVDDQEIKPLLKNILVLPRRPIWTTEMSKATLEKQENKAFLDWRRALALFQEEYDVVLTPYEKNLEIWRQLWRVIEKSHLVIQIVDGRNPMLFYNKDLITYVGEQKEIKKCLVIINKADLLKTKEREIWSQYLSNENIDHLFYSAKTNMDLVDEENNIQEFTDTKMPSNKTSESIKHVNGMSATVEDNPKINRNDTTVNKRIKNDIDIKDTVSSKGKEIKGDIKETKNEDADIKIRENITTESSINYNVSMSINKGSKLAINTKKVIMRHELIAIFNEYRKLLKLDGLLMIGMVGYPNVGKSTTINSLIGHKKVATAATPGKTKHYQTLYLSNDICLCDCPGLVFPAATTSKADLLINGILPVDQMRDYIEPANIIVKRISKEVLEKTYGIKLPSNPTGSDLLDLYANNRGFRRGIDGSPDQARAARIIFKDYISGKLNYVNMPEF